MTKITESTIEKFAIELLGNEGLQYIFPPFIVPDRDIPTRKIQ
jgi:type I restriction enzyme R subunit